MKNKEAKKHFNRGQKRQKAGNDAEAIAAYTVAIELEPHNAEIYNSRAISYRYLGELEQSLQDLNQALAIEPNYLPAYHQRGNVYQMQEQWDKALENYNKVIELNPDYMSIYVDRALLYERTEQWNLALAEYDQLIERNPNAMVFYYLYRSECYAKQGKYEQALADSRKVNQLSDHYPMLDKSHEYQSKLVKPQDFKPIKIQSLELDRLYALPQLAMEFGQINLFLGKNSTGKTTLLALLHCIASETPKKHLRKYFKLSLIEQANIQASLQSYSEQWLWQSTSDETHNSLFFFDSVFLPPTELLSWYSAILGDSEEYPRFYSTTCQKLLDNHRGFRELNQQESLLECFEQYYQEGETVKPDPNLESHNAFIYQLASGETIPFKQGAQGIKKVQQLRLLLENHSINRNSVLLIDEVEAHLHPALVRQFVRILAALAAKGVQIFIASHSYFVLKELVIASKQQQQSAFCFSLTKRGCVRNNLKDGVPTNEILSESLDMNDCYDEVMWHD